MGCQLKASDAKPVNDAGNDLINGQIDHQREVLPEGGVEAWEPT